MRKLLSLVAVPLLLLSCAPMEETDSASGPAAEIPVVAIPALSQSTMVDITRILASDEFGGRAPGTPGEEMTVALLEKRFAEAGLQPGNGDSWTQTVPLVEINATQTSDLVVEGEGEPLRFDFGGDWVGVTYREAGKVAVEASEMVFVGYGVNAPELGWNDYADVDVTGKTVVILVNDPDFGTESLDGPFGGRAMTYYGRWTYKYEEAARQGAAAALIVHDTEPASYGWNVVEGGWSGPQFYAQSANGNADQTLINGWVQKDTARRIMTAAGLDLDRQMAAAKQRGFRAVPLGLSVGMALENSIRKMQSRNVIGILPGSKRPDEYVLYTAHWDHLGRCTPIDGDDICNGAVDNATGTAALVALAEAHAKIGAPDRSLVFLAVAAEESGLLGSQYYAQNPIYPLSQTVGGINMDAFLMAGPARNVSVVGYGKSELDAYLEAALAADGRIAEPEPTPEKGFYYRSDHFSFAKLGVPMLYFDGGEDLIEGGRAAGEAAAADYTANRYHTAKDEFDPEWDWSGVMADLRIYYAVGRMLAMTAAWPNWAEGDEFRAIRDASRPPQAEAGEEA